MEFPLLEACLPAYSFVDIVIICVICGLFCLNVHYRNNNNIYFSVNVSVCFVCCVLDSVCELFGETIRNVFGCSCYFVVECYGCV